MYMNSHMITIMHIEPPDLVRTKVVSSSLARIRSQMDLSPDLISTPRACDVSDLSAINTMALEVLLVPDTHMCWRGKNLLFHLGLRVAAAYIQHRAFFPASIISGSLLL